MYNIRTDLISNIIEEHLLFCNLINGIRKVDNFYSYATVNDITCELICTEYCNNKVFIYIFTLKELNKEIIVAFTDDRIKSFTSFVKSIQNLLSVLNSNITNELTFILADSYTDTAKSQVSTFTVVGDEQKNIHCCKLHNMENFNKLLDSLSEYVVDIVYTLLDNIISDIYSDYLCDKQILNLSFINTQTDFFMFSKLETDIPTIEEMENAETENNTTIQHTNDNWEKDLISLRAIMSKMDKRKFYTAFGLDLSNLINKVNTEISSTTN